MQFEIEQIETVAKSKPVRLGLRQDEDGAVSIVTLDGSGREGYSLVVFQTDGKLVRPRWISDDLGFDLDEDGRIREAD